MKTFEQEKQINVIVIDDQPDVVKGLLSGVNWVSLKVTEVFHAYNIFEAKKLIEEHPIQVMLCDIEMPMGTGLELYEWVRERYPEIKCIFLTSHADFTYAQTAIRLGGFDYLLQPASYGSVEKVLHRAIDQIKGDQMIKEYYEFGKGIRAKEISILDSLWREYLTGLQTSRDEVLTTCRSFDIELSEDTSFGTGLIQIVEWETAPWEYDLFVYALRNISMELLEPYDADAMVIPLDNQYFAVLIYHYREDSDLLGRLQIFFSRILECCRDYLQCGIACFLGSEKSFKELPQMLHELLHNAENNVAGQKKVFLFDEEEKPVSYDFSGIQRWRNLLSQGYCSLVQEEVHTFLNRQAELGNLSLEFLSRFHQDFLQIFFDVIQKYQLKAHEIFSEEYNYESLMKSYSSLEKMLDLVDFSIRYIESKMNHEESGQSQIDKIVDFIQKNIQRNIGRKEIADAVYLNPEYLSRLFKKEKGISLSEFMLQEKMKIAESLLKNTNFSVGIIASKVGYTNFSHFAQAFKKTYGVSPSDYRQKANES